VRARSEEKHHRQCDCDSTCRHEELEPILDFVPPVHQLYEQELFPEIEFSRRGSELLQPGDELDGNHNASISSIHWPILEKSFSDDAVDYEGARRAGESEGGWPAYCATSEQHERRSLHRSIEGAEIRGLEGVSGVNEPVIITW